MLKFGINIWTLRVDKIFSKEAALVSPKIELIRYQKNKLNIFDLINFKNITQEGPRAETDSYSYLKGYFGKYLSPLCGLF